MSALTLNLAERSVFGVLLTSVRRPEKATPDDRRKDTVAILAALEGYRGVTFTLQWSADPRVGDPTGGRVEVALLVSAPADMSAERLEELADDVLDLLNGPPHLWRFVPVDDPDLLARLVQPLNTEHFAEIARREEEVLVKPGSKGAGFNPIPGSSEEHSIWSLWTLGPGAPDTSRLAASLLAQEAPVTIRLSIEPAVLSGDERGALEALIHEEDPDYESTASYRAAYRTLESLVYPQPLFTARCVVASADRLSPSLLSTIGQALSEPAQHINEPPPVLVGGYAINKDTERLATVFANLGRGEALESLAPPGLERLRSLLGVWEAANVFRLPVLAEVDTQGLPVNERPVLPGVLRSLPAEGTRIGELAEYPGRPVAVASADRFRHTYVVGQTGTGKSTLLLNMALDDITAGHGVCVIDPHGDLVDAILARIPSERRNDVVLVDPGDPVAVVGVNLIEAESDLQRNYLMSELAAMMYALYDPKRQGIVGPRFESMMRNAILLLQSQDEVRASLLDVPTVFGDEAVRKFLLNAAQSKDPTIAEFWQTEASSRRSNEWGEVQAWFRSKFDVFSTSLLTRAVLGQAESTVSFTEVLRERKILLVNLSKGALGEYNSAMLGHVVAMKLWGAILERAIVPRSERHPFFVYIDEFQSITTESLGTMLAEARKYNVGLTLANQFFEQLSFDTRAALLGNVGSKLAFRLGPTDAEAFSDWLGGGLDADELAHLPNYETVAALSPSGVPTPPALIRTFPPGEEDLEVAAAVREASRQRHGTPLDVADDRFRRRWVSVPGSFAAKTFGEPPPPQFPPPRGGAPFSVRDEGTPTKSFLDEWLEKQNRTPSRRWTWIDDWIASRLATRDPGQLTLLRLTGTPQLLSKNFVPLAEAARVPQDLLRPVFQLNSPGFLELPRTAASRVVLHARSFGFGAELFDWHRAASAPLPGHVEIARLHLPEIVEQRLSLRSIATIDDLRKLDSEGFASFDLPPLLMEQLKVLRGDVKPADDGCAKPYDLGQDEILWHLSEEDERDLIQVCHSRAGELADRDLELAIDDTDTGAHGMPRYGKNAPERTTLSATFLKVWLDVVRDEVRDRYSEILEILGQ